MATRNTARSDGRSSRNARKEDEDRDLVDRFMEVSDGVTEALGTPWALAASNLTLRSRSRRSMSPWATAPRRAFEKAVW